MGQQPQQHGRQFLWRYEWRQSTRCQLAHRHVTGGGALLHGLSEAGGAEGVISQAFLVV